MEIYIKNKKYYIDFKTILRNILVILVIMLFTKYINIIDNYNNVLLTKYEHFVEYAQEKDIAITQANYISYIQSHINK